MKSLKKPGGFAAAFSRAASRLASAVLVSFPLFATSPAYAVQDIIEPHTSYSDAMRQLQQKIMRNPANPRVVYMDRDALGNNFALRQASPGFPQKRAEVMADFIKARTGWDVPANIFLKPLSDSVLGLDGLSYRSGGAYNARKLPGPPDLQQEICMVFGRDPDTDVSLIVGLGDNFMKNIYPGLKQISPTTAEDLDKFNIYADYHETGHCFDRWYDPHLVLSSDITAEDALDLERKSESFADAFAVLRMARDGIRDYGYAITDQRLMNFAFFSPFLQQTAANEFNHKGDEIYRYLIYKSAFNAQKTVESMDKKTLSGLTDPEIADLAHDIVEQSIMPVRQVEHAVVYMMSTLYRLDGWETMKNYYPHIKAAYDIAQEIMRDIKQALNRNYLYNGEKVNSLTDISFRIRDGALSGLYETPDRQVVLDQVNTLREKLLSMAREQGSDLITVADRYRDELRHTLRAEPEASHPFLMRQLQIMDWSLRLALKENGASRPEISP